MANGFFRLVIYSRKEGMRLLLCLYISFVVDRTRKNRKSGLAFMELSRSSSSFVLICHVFAHFMGITKSGKSSFSELYWNHRDE